MKRFITRIAVGMTAVAAMVGMTACAGGTGGGGGGGGDGLKVGISIAAGQNSTLQAIVSGLEAELGRNGGELIKADAALSIDKQIADIDSFVNQGVDAIVVIPIDFPTLSNALNRADAAGIPLFANDAVSDPNVTAEQLAPFTAQVQTGRHKAGQDVAAFINERTGGQGKVGAIGIAAPVAQIEYFVGEFTTSLQQYPGLEFVGEKGNQSDDAAGGRPLADAFITEHPDIAAIFSYNDPSAVGVSTAAVAAGKRDQITITGFNAQQDGLDAVKSGAIDATWDYSAPDQGQLFGKLIVAKVVDGKDLEPNYVVECNIITSENIDEFVSWEDRITQIGEGSYEGIPIS